MTQRQIVNIMETTLIDKMIKNPNYIRYTFYEVNVKYLQELLGKAGVNIENKQEYTNDDKRYILRQVSEFIMSHSSKNGNISRLQSDYSRIFEKTTEEKSNDRRNV